MIQGFLKIDTYDISILPYEDCCTIFVPRHPVINPNIKHIHYEESKFDFEPLVEEAINNIEIIELNEKRSDLLQLLLFNYDIIKMVIK